MSYQENPSSLRACVFIDSSNPEYPNQIMNHSPHPFIKPPFPPLINPKDLLIISKDNKPSRSPNAFIIYRKVFLKTTRDQGYFLPMTIVSSMASKSWDQESDEVRDYYKRLAKEAYNYRTEKFPKKVKRRRKKEPWNANIAFQNDLHNTFFDNLNPPENPSLSPELFLSTENGFSSQNSSQQINKTPLFNEPDYQNLFSSPSLSNSSSITSSPEINLNSELFSYNNSDCQNSQNVTQSNLGQSNIEQLFGQLHQDNYNNNNYISFNNTISNATNQIDYTNYNTEASTAGLSLYSGLYSNVLGIANPAVGLEYEGNPSNPSYL